MSQTITFTYLDGRTEELPAKELWLTNMDGSLYRRQFVGTEADCAQQAVLLELHPAEYTIVDPVVNKVAHRRVESKENYIAMDGKWVDLYLIMVVVNDQVCHQEFARGSNGRQITLNGYAWSKEFESMCEELK